MITRLIRVIGMVQGIGYRPFVVQLAEKLGIRGQVRNTAGIVAITATASKESLTRFADRLKNDMPYGARVDQVTIEDIAYQEFTAFTIEQSQMKDRTIQTTQIPFIPPDLATCPDCERELMEKGNMRQGYSFISCVKCGPRYSIIHKLPYDRERTTMNVFKMCPECQKDYSRSGDIRRFAQTISCPDCGPQLILEEYFKDAKTVIHEKYYALLHAVQIIKNGGILAVKDIGGFHLACMPDRENTVQLLRQLKGRERKPFAVMFGNVSQVHNYCVMSQKEQELLESSARPIVLMKRKKNGNVRELFVNSVCNDSPDIGAMLPCNPLQILLIKMCGPLIMTSANYSGEPIMIHNNEVCKWLKKAVKEDIDSDVSIGTLMHEREILMPLEDSIVRIVKNRVQTFRRARGFVPEPILLKEDSKKQIFAAGGDLKSTFCYMAGNRAYLSQQFGDLESLTVSDQYDQNYRHMHDLFGFAPEKIAIDLHPDYLSGRKAKELTSYFKNKRTIPVHLFQHHQAHVASVIAEHGLHGNLIGIAFDGTGYGTDHNVWGSEFFLYQDDEFKRVAHLQQVSLIGGNEGAKNTDLILSGYLESLGISDQLIEKWLQKQMDKAYADSFYQRQAVVRQAMLNKINTLQSTSMGRLFDAVSALLNICHYNHYEGEAAIELEYLANTVTPCQKGKYPLHLDPIMGKNELSTDTKSLFEQIIEALSDGAKPAQLAFEFITAIADYVVWTCSFLNHWDQKQHILIEKNRNNRLYNQIALSGGTFQNRILLEQVIDKLERKGYAVYMNEKVPAGDGGICLGQAYLAMKEDRAACERKAYVYCNTRESD